MRCLVAVLAVFPLTGGSAPAGCGVFCVSASPIIRHCSIRNNEATGSSKPDGGGGIQSRGSARPTIEKCTIVGNDTPGRGDGVFNVSTEPRIENCIIRDNGSEARGNAAGGDAIVTYSNAKGGDPGRGNVGADPP